MKPHRIRSLLVAAGVSAFVAMATPVGADPPLAKFKWQTVVNKNDPMPHSTTGRTFNSFNQPAVNAKGLVVFRARSRGGPPEGPPTRGIYTRDMSTGGEINIIAGGDTPVPPPNNIIYPPDYVLTTFIEFPSIPRIGIRSNAVATRGNHQPVWEYDLPDGETRAGTTGVYVNLDGNDPLSDLITGASKLGAMPPDSLFNFEVFAVPGITSVIPFDVFPGSPSVTDDGIIAFKGNYTDGIAKTGVFYRELEAELAGGPAYVELIANSDTEIPNPGACPNGTAFGSTAPPSAAAGVMVFAGLDNEEEPTCGGIYQAPLAQPPQLTTLVGLESEVPGIPGETFTRLGEGLSYDERFVGFWGAWGTATRTLVLACPTQGNQNRIAFCVEQFPNGFETEVPVHQGIFVHDTRTGQTRMVARTGADFDDFVYWKFSGRVPGSNGGGHSQGHQGRQEGRAPDTQGGEEDGELARWRSSAFVAVSSRGAAVRVAFKARTGEIDGIYLARELGRSPIVTVLDTMMLGQALDPEALPGLMITELGLERDSFRGRWLVISARMGGHDEEDGMAGIYLTNP
jgi:hypothetical protein